MTADSCPASREYPAAFLRCNLHVGHVGPHDNDVEEWTDDATVPGPDRLQQAAICLNGSSRAWDAFRKRLRKDFGEDDMEKAVHAFHDVLVGWRGRA